MIRKIPGNVAVFSVLEQLEDGSLPSCLYLSLSIQPVLPYVTFSEYICKLWVCFHCY